MSRTLVINATNARKNLFNLIEQVVDENIQVVITKNNARQKVILKKQDENYKAYDIEKSLRTVDRLYNSIKTPGYDKDEMKKAEKIFIEDYKEQHSLK